MSAKIPNYGSPGNDTCRDPQLINVPVVLYDNHGLGFWYPEALDYSSANQLAWTLSESGGYARRIDIPLILPPTDWILGEPGKPALVRCDPFHVKLVAESA